MAKSRAQKCEEAEARNAVWASFHPQKRLKILDDRGLLAKRQRAKIQKEIDGKKASN